jgi:hypothetical protein
VLFGLSAVTQLADHRVGSIGLFLAVLRHAGQDRQDGTNTATEAIRLSMGAPLGKVGTTVGACRRPSSRPRLTHVTVRLIFR